MELDNEVLSIYINDIVNGVVESNKEENSKNLFLMLLDGIKKDSNLSRLLDNTIIAEFIQVLPELEILDDRLEAMNAVLSIMYHHKYNNHGQINELFQLFLECSLEDGSSFARVKEAIGLFTVLGIAYDFIFEQFINRYSKEYCIALFSEIKGNFGDKVIEKYSDIVGAIEQIRKRIKRFEIILHFYLMTDSHWIDNFDVIKGYLREVKNYSKLCADWMFSSEKDGQNYVLENILTEREQKIFVAVGNIYNSCIDENISIDTKMGKSTYLKMAADKFYLTLQTKEMKKLLEEFRAGKDFMEIAVGVPSCG